MGVHSGWYGDGPPTRCNALMPTAGNTESWRQLIKSCAGRNPGLSRSPGEASGWGWAAGPARGQPVSGTTLL